MAARKLRAIIFDIGRVLVRLDISSATNGLSSGPSLSPAELWGAIEKDPRWTDWQSGRISPRDWHLHMSKRFGGSLTFEQFKEVWSQALDPKPLQDTKLLERLSKRYRLGLLSNTDPIHVAHLEATYDFFRLFPIRIYSCRVGACKPDPLIYREALRACKVLASEAVYIDDIPGFVHAAECLGMAGIEYKSPDKLVQDLLNLGVAIS
jgi:putative hydrolase of the HAD superfamily